MDSLEKKSAESDDLENNERKTNDVVCYQRVDNEEEEDTEQHNSQSIRKRRSSTDAPTRTIPSAGLGRLKVEDHFSVPRSSSIHHYQGKDTLLFPLSPQGALVLEHDKIDQTKPLTVKYFNDATTGFYVIRGFFFMIAMLLVALVFIFSIQVILFLWIGLVIDFGFTTVQDLSSGRFFLSLGSICSIPGFLYGTSAIMGDAAHFALDAWEGHLFIATFLETDSVLISWLSTFVYIFVPMIFMGCSLLAGSSTWWDDTLCVWPIAIFLYFVVYVLGSTYYEIKGCLELIHFHPVTRHDRRFVATKIYSIANARQCWFVTTLLQLSGVERVRYLTIDEHTPASEETYEDSKNEEYFSSSISLYSRFTVFLSKFGLFRKVPDPQRLYTVNEAIDLIPVISSATWSLERIYCRNRNVRQLAIISGKAALRPNQAKSSFACFLISFFLKLLVFIGILVWLGLGGLITAGVCLLFTIISFAGLRRGVKISNIVEAVRKDRSQHSLSESRYLYEAFPNYRITIPSYDYCRIITGIKVIVFFLFPVTCLIVSNNLPVAFIFVMYATFSTIQDNFNLSLIFEELGSIEGVEDNCVSTDEEWSKKHKYSIMGSKNNDVWLKVFSFFMVLFGFVFFGAVIGIGGELQTHTLKFATDFVYPGGAEIPYPTCSFADNTTAPSNSNTHLVDFSLLASLAYKSEEVREETLSAWFVNESYIDHTDVITEFRESYERNNRKSAVEYIFIGFPDRNLGVVSIRGTTSLIDTLVDFQLWSGAGLARVFRHAIPGGVLLSSIFRRMIDIVAYVQSGTLEQISFYQQTTAFMKDLQEKKMYNNLALTGHSLGGGLAMITAAQTKIPSITISSPNALLSSHSFGPDPVTESLLDKYTFAVVPDRDVVTWTDDLAQNFQRINCKAAANKFIECHDVLRTICELLYTCGSYGRPIPCECAEYGYAEPDVINTNGKSFSDICSE